MNIRVDWSQTAVNLVGTEFSWDGKIDKAILD